MEIVWEEETKRARVLVARTEETLRSHGMKVTTAVEQGDPKSAIIDAAEQWRADLIVLGSHGRGALDRFLMGSVSDAIVRHARCSVEIVRIPSGR
jgi:nucleotide-binding universal stress UspA family protein